METEEALKEGLLEANKKGDLTCNVCDIQVVNWRAHSGGIKHRKKEIDRQERMLNEIKRKKREEGNEDHELSLEAALKKGIVKAKSCGKITCEICKVEVEIWNQHISEHHRKEKLARDEKYEENRGGKDTKEMEEEKQEEVEVKEKKEESEATIEELEKLLFSFEAQPGSKEEGEQRTRYFLQQARKFAQEIDG